MGHIVYSKEHGALAYVDAPAHKADLRPGEFAIPCEKNADIDDTERWKREAEAMEYGARYAPSTESARERKRAELMEVRDELIARGFPWSGNVFPLTPDVQALLMQEYLGSQILPGPSYAWKDVTGEYKPIGDAEAFQGFCMQAMAYGKALFAREAMLHGMISAEQSVEEVEKISWDTVPEK